MARRANDLLLRLTGRQLQKPAQLGRSPVAEKRPTGSTPTKPKAAKAQATSGIPGDVDDADVAIARTVKPRTMTSYDKLFPLISATRYVARHDIAGDVVECGVWRGGSMMAMALTLSEEGATDRHLHLFDTFEGMPPPTEEDQRRKDGADAQLLLDRNDKSSTVWAAASQDDVRAGMESTPYPKDRIHYHAGMVEDTIPDHAPERISLLRLDTDWYDSTVHELEHLYDRLTPGGVIVFDDYGYWEGARKAVDEFLDRTGEPLLLIRTGTGRLAVKPPTTK
ncbi:MAG: class I SAM-dependent methyltransferase [Microthrixaceae bacterium]|nr:class I SAM-dependent methyltransferase [Microthrixaceae bacterium]